MEESEYNFLFKLYAEEPSCLKNMDETKRLYKILKKISSEAEMLNLDNKEEIRIMCRKRFAEKIDTAYFLWD